MLPAKCLDHKTNKYRQVSNKAVLKSEGPCNVFAFFKRTKGPHGHLESYILQAFTGAKATSVFRLEFP
jgi:hypothetical protein